MEASIKTTATDLTAINITKAQEIIMKSSAKVTAVSAIPVPLLDIAGMTYIQTKMINDLANLYGVHNEGTNQVLIASGISAMISKLVSEVLESMISGTTVDKMLSDSIVKATISGLLTTSTGELYASHFQNGGTLEDLTLDSIVEYVKGTFNSDKLSLKNISASAFNGILSKYNIA